MKKKPDKQCLPQANAETQFARTPLAETSIHSVDEALRELRVHQIELETQNEELRHAYIAIEEARDRYMNLYEFAPVGYLTLTREGLIAEINLTGAALLGVERKKLLNHHFAALVRSKDSDRWYCLFRKLMRSEREEYDVELMLQSGENSLFHAQLHCLVATDNHTQVVHITLIDITQRKFAEEALLDLSSHLATAQEDERARIAREVHDELGGILTALKMDLNGLTKQLPKDLTECHEKAAIMNYHLDDAILIARKIITNLRPDILDHLGLLAALDWKLDEFKQQSGIQCVLTVPENNIEMDKNRNIAVFRIMQEALTNIALHSGASQVTVDVEADANSVMMRITDNGCGMTKAQMCKTGKYGILGMHERALHFGGEVVMDSHPGKGTALVLTMPLKSPSVPFAKGGGQSRGGSS